MSARRCREARRVSLRCRCLILFIALLLGGAARPGAALTAPPVSFRPPITYDQPAPVALERVTGEPLMAADLDGDGRLDLVVITRQGLSILYGNGDGTFAPPVDLPLGPGLQEGTAADVNGDGLPDLVYCDFDRGKVAVLINQGGRRFSSPYYYPASDGPVGITAADFNGDGKPDLAVSCHLSGDLVVLLNRGDGTFLPPVSLGRIDYPGGVISGDFNGDGHVDLAETSLTENVVRILLGDGTGRFKEGGRYPSDSAYANRVVAADFNGDGIPDLAVACQSEYAILFGDGKGGFGPAIRYPGLPLVDAGDFGGDGAPDLVAPGVQSGGFSLYLNRPAGNFLPPQAFPGPGGKTDGIVVGDFNGDGRPDVVTWNEGSPHLAVFLNATPQPTPAVRSLTLNPADPIGGCDQVVATVTLTAPAPRGGALIELTSTNRAANVEASQTIPAGAVQIRFAFAPAPTSVPAWGPVTASYNGTAARAALLVRPGGNASLHVEPTTVVGTAGATGHLTLPCPAGPDGLVVRLSSSSASADVPGTVTAPPGATTVDFPVLTFKVPAAELVTIDARFLGETVPGTFWLQPPPNPAAVPAPPVPPATPPRLTLSLFPNPVPGGLLALGQVTLPQPAGPGGAAVTLTSSSPTVALVPATAAVLPGASAVTFPILTFPVNQPTPVTITAGGAFGPATATLQVLPLTSPVPSPPPAARMRLLVSSHDSNSILRFDGQTGAFIDTFVAPGSGGLEGPHGLALGPDGNLYVASRFRASILRFDGQTGAFIDAFVPPGRGGLDLPIGVLFGPDGNLYVSSYGTDAILRYNGRTGAHLEDYVFSRQGGLTAPYAFGFGPDGHMYICSRDQNCIYDAQRLDYGEFVVDQIFTPGAGGLDEPNGMTFGPDGNIYVSSGRTHSVLRYDGHGYEFLGVFVPPHSGGLTEPQDLKFGPDGNLYVASAGTDQVLRYDGRTGAFVGVFAAGAGLSRPDWLLFVPAPLPAAPLPAPTNLAVRFVPGAGIQLTWQDNSSDETAFAVWRRGGGADGARIAALAPHTTAYLDASIAPGVAYTYRVRAIRADVASDWSNEVTVTTPAGA